MIDKKILESLNKEPDYRPAPIVYVEPDQIPVVIEDVAGQGSSSELPDHADLPERYKDLSPRSTAKSRRHTLLRTDCLFHPAAPCGFTAHS